MSICILGFLLMGFSACTTSNWGTGEPTRDVLNFMVWQQLHPDTPVWVYQVVEQPEYRPREKINLLGLPPARGKSSPETARRNYETQYLKE